MTASQQLRARLLEARAALDRALDALPAEAPPAPVATGVPRFMDQRDFARHMDVSLRTVQGWVARGLPVVRMSNRLIRIEVLVAEEWLRLHQGKGKAA